MRASWPILKDYDINRRRLAAGKKPATSIWLWGQGRSPQMPTLNERFGLTGAVISAVDLIRGIGKYAGLKPILVPGATGFLDTNYAGKVAAALDALKDMDLVFVHVEAPDEAGHSGELKLKLQAIEDFDAKVVGPMRAGLDQLGDYRLLVLCDHFTPLILRTHTDEPVPFILYDSRTPGDRPRPYTEAAAKDAGLLLDQAADLLPRLLERLEATRGEGHQGFTSGTERPRLDRSSPLPTRIKYRGDPLGRPVVGKHLLGRKGQTLGPFLLQKSLQTLLQIPHRVLEDGQAGAHLFGVGFAPAAPGFFFPGPGGVLERGDMGFGVGHEAQDPAGGVRDAGDVQQRPVGVMGKPAPGDVSRGAGVFQGDLAPVGQLRQDGAIGVKFPLPVADGQFQTVQPLSKHALGVHGLEVDPGVPKIAAIVGDERRQAGVGPPGQARQHPQVDQDLEAVADADDQAAGLDEFL